MIDPTATLSVSRQAIVLGISRGSVYYKPRPVSDAVFVERLWRTIKYEEVYLRAYASVSEARAGIGRYLTFYNGRRPHSSLDGKTPDQAYFNQPMPEAVAA